MLFPVSLLDARLRGSFGFPAIGPRSVPLPAGNKRAASNGFNIEVDQKDAAIVRRIFDLFVTS